VLVAVVIATLATATAHAAPPPEHRADPSLTTYVQRAGPFTVGSYGMFEDAVKVTPPPADGAIVGMDARLVDARGNVIPQHVAMLHHLVFTNGGPDNGRSDRACPFSASRERFYGTSEELRPLSLPRGYGYPTSAADKWRALLMVMHHRASEREFFLEYRVTVDPRPVIPVMPYWLSVIPCVADPQWSVPGDGKGPHRRTREFTMPEAGRIIAVGGHLHGGALGLELSQPRCRRTLVRSTPAYAPKDDPLYAVKPLLHEPDPKAVSWWQSATGWPVRANEKLKVTAVYDGTRPHTRVMGISHVYIAPGGAPSRCAAGPRDGRTLGPGFKGARRKPPKVRLTLARLGKDGLARPSARPAGAPSTATQVTVDGFAFQPDHLEITAGSIVRWRFAERGVKHDVTLADGPLGFGSPWLSDGGRYGRRFTDPGTYLLHCSLHPAFMSQVVTVKPSQPPLPGADRLRR
jgi:plastocyanin